MDQKKIGSFLKELRKEKKLTQEQLAEVLGVSNRSISRWENGVSLPDFDLVIELSRYFSVSIEEFLDGEKKAEMSDQKTDSKTEQTLLKVAGYEGAGKKQFSGRICILVCFAIAAFGIYSLLVFLGLAFQKGYSGLASFSMGFVFAALLVGALYTSSYMAKVRAAKRRLFCKLKRLNREKSAPHKEN